MGSRTLVRNGVGRGDINKIIQRLKTMAQRVATHYIANIMAECCLGVYTESSLIYDN